MLLKQYAGLLWSVCRRRLENDEDIKECVNSTFAEICLHQEKYDADKGSLKNYLCMMADRKAIDRYHENTRRQQAEETFAQEEQRKTGASGNTGEGICAADGAPMTMCTLGSYPSGENRAAEKLEEALEQLDPMDSQILRMKYYDGMTYQEIAAQLGLTVGTVKMRSLRSRKKLFKILIVVLILALLAACAVAVLRRYQFSEHGGFTWSDEISMYEMVDGEVAWENHDMRYHVNDAIFTLRDDGSLQGDLNVYITVEWLNGKPHYSDEEAWVRLGTESLLDVGFLNTVGEKSNLQEYISWKMVDDVLEYEVRLEWELEKEGRRNITVPLYMDDQWLTEITLEPIDPMEYEDSGEGVKLLNGTEWSLGPALIGDEHTIVSLFGPRSRDWIVSSRLYACKYTPGPEEDKIKLVDQDGTEYPIRRAIYDQWQITQLGQITQFDLYFPVVPAGEYTLHIPTVCYERDWTSEEITVTLPEEENVWTACDVTMLFPDGSGLHLTSITKKEYVHSQYSMDSDTETLREEKFYWWEYVFDYETYSAESPQFQLVELESVDVAGNMSIYREENQISFQVPQELGLTELTLYLTNPEYLVKHDFTIPVTVEAAPETSVEEPAGQEGQ